MKFLGKLVILGFFHYFYSLVSGLVCVDGCLNCLSDTGVCGACIDGKYGDNCDLNCTFADNCKHRICASDGTRCHAGCIDKRYGDTCKYGCPSYLCFGNYCNSVTGICDSCPHGKYGRSCTKHCSSTCQQCHQDTGACTEYNPITRRRAPALRTAPVNYNTDLDGYYQTQEKMTKYNVS